MGSDRIDPAVVSSLDRPELTRLWQAARVRLEGNGNKVTAAPLKLPDLDEAELGAICALLGRRLPRNANLSVSLAQLDSALSDSAVGAGLLATLTVMSGPIRNRRDERAVERVARDDLWAAAAEHPASERADVREWIDTVKARGRMTRLPSEERRRVLVAVLDAVEALLEHRDARVDSPVPLPVVAAAQFGDAHALDPDNTVGSLAADAILTLSGQGETRSAWACFGVQVDRVNSSVLAHMLPGASGSILAAAAAAGEPIRVTHRMLDRGLELDLTRTGRVFICENPAIVSLAADRLGDRCAPLVCLDGMPGSVAARLLDEILASGTELCVHADLDAGGVAIASHVLKRFGAVPWRMGASDYRAALERPTTALPQRITSTSWDPELASLMNQLRRAIHEEVLVDLLLADLER